LVFPGTDLVAILGVGRFRAAFDGGSDLAGTGFAGSQGRIGLDCESCTLVGLGVAPTFNTVRGRSSYSCGRHGGSLRKFASIWAKVWA